MSSIQGSSSIELDGSKDGGEDWFGRQVPDRRIVLKKDEILFRQGDPPDYLYRVKQGCVVMVKESPFGNPLITERLEPGEFFGGFAIMGDFPYPATARTERPSVVEGFLREKVWSAIVSDPLFRRHFFHEIGRRIQDFQSRLLISKEPVRIRLARMILSLCRKNPETGERRLDPQPVMLLVTRKSLSLMSGTSVESVIRLTRQWEKEGVLDLSVRGRVVVLDPGYFMSLTYEQEEIDIH